MPQDEQQCLAEKVETEQTGMLSRGSEDGDAL